jgi:hypothetical protein
MHLDGGRRSEHTLEEGIFFYFRPWATVHLTSPDLLALAFHRMEWTDCSGNGGSETESLRREAKRLAAIPC